MDKVSVFESSDFGELRIIVDPKGDVWFVASDVAKSLGYINAKDAVKRHVDDDDSMLLQVSDNQWGVKRSILKTRYIDSIRIINESGLYSLILSSKLESAKRFKKWVTSEVLPSIRKTGEYKTSSGGEFVFMFGHLEGRTRFVFECFDPRPDHEGKNTYIVSYFDKGLRRRDVVDVLCYMNVLAK